MTGWLLRDRFLSKTYILRIDIIYVTNLTSAFVTETLKVHIWWQNIILLYLLNLDFCLILSELSSYS